MRIDTRRAVLLVLLFMAVVVVVVLIRTLTGLMPKAGRTDTGRTASAGLEAPTAPAPSRPEPADSPDPAPPPVDLSGFDRDRDLFGQVVALDGAPVPGAHVQAVFRRPRRVRTHAPDDAVAFGPTGTSGPDGVFGVRLLRGQKAALRVTADGFAPYERRAETAGTRVLVVLRPAVSCIVRVKDSAGRPVTGVSVRLLRPPARSDVVFDRTATSDAEGRARFDGLPGGLLATTDPPGDWPTPVERPGVALPLRGTLSLEVSVPPGRTIRGRVTDERTGLPVGGARVRLAVPRGLETTTDAEGQYSLDGVPVPWQPRSDDVPRRPWIGVTADGYVPLGADVREGDRCDVGLDPSLPLTGRVVDAAGRAIAGAWASLPAGGGAGAWAGARDVWASAPSATTGVEGRFRVPAGARHSTLRIEAPGFAPLERGVDRSPSHSGPLDLGDLVLGPGRMLEGRVSDGEGRPMPDARVILDGEDRTTNEFGRFCFRDLVPGPHVLRAVARGRDQLVRHVVLAVDHDPTVFDLSFPAGREVVIDVRDTAGAPVAASLDVVGRRIYESSDVEGRGVVIVPPGPWSVRVSAGRHRYADGRSIFVEREVSIPAGETRVSVTLDRAPPPEDMLPIEGIVVDDAGRPVEGASLEVFRTGAGDPSQRPDRVRSGEGGHFRMLVPKGAVCDIRAVARRVPNAPPSMGEPREPWEGESKGVSAGATDVTVVAHPDPEDRTLTVLALSPEGDPLAGARVSLSCSMGRDVHARTAGDGRAVLSRLHRLTYSASVDPPESRRDEWLPGFSGSFVPEGQEITVRLHRAAHITGTVLLPDGSPARGAYVTFTSGSTRRDEWVDAAGRFRLAVDAALPLPWRLRAALGDDWPPIEVVEDLASPPTGDVTLRLVDTMRR